MWQNEGEGASLDDHMGSSNGKHAGEKENNKRRSHFRRLFQINHTPRPVSYAGANEYYEEQQTSTRPMSMIDVGPIDNLEISETTPTMNLSPARSTGKYPIGLLLLRLSIDLEESSVLSGDHQHEPILNK